MIVEVGNVLVHLDILTENFCCDLAACKGECCIEGDAGAPVTIDEIAAIEDCVDTVWSDLSASAQAVIDHQGVAYADPDGDLVTSIVDGRDCVFTYYDDIDIEGQCVKNCCLCALEKAHRAGKSDFVKPISCALYPIREAQFTGGLVGITYNRWDVCRPAVALGNRLGLPLYKFLKNPLIRRFGEQWYDELCLVAEEYNKSLKE